MSWWHDADAITDGTIPCAQALARPVQAEVAKLGFVFFGAGVYTRENSHLDFLIVSNR